MENQLDSVTEKPTCFLRLQGLACVWSKHNKHSRNIFSVHGFLRLSVINHNTHHYFQCCLVVYLSITRQIVYVTVAFGSLFRSITGICSFI